MAAVHVKWTLDSHFYFLSETFLAARSLKKDISIKMLY